LAPRGRTMAAAPLAFAVGAGALAGSAFVALQEHGRLQRRADFRAGDQRLQELLQNASGAGSALRLPQQLQEAPPVWVLMVHIGEAKLSQRLKAKRLRVVVKYGNQGWSLKRESKELRPATTGDDDRPSVSFNETFAFLLRRGVAPTVRLRLKARGRTVAQTLSKKDFVLNLDPSTQYYEERLWRMASVQGQSNRTVGTMQVVVEVRPFTLSDLCSYGFNVGRVVPQVTIGDVVAERQSGPMVQGEAVRASPVIIIQQQEERARRLQEEQPTSETDSEADTATGSEADTATGSEAESSESECRGSSRRNTCPNFPWHCPD